MLNFAIHCYNEFRYNKTHIQWRHSLSSHLKHYYCVRWLANARHVTWVIDQSDARKFCVLTHCVDFPPRYIPKLREPGNAWCRGKPYFSLPLNLTYSTQGKYPMEVNKIIQHTGYFLGIKPADCTTLPKKHPQTLCYVFWKKKGYICTF